jgi:GDP-D-mannose dehydratase
MNAIITGISGQDVAYLANELLNDKIKVTGIVRDKSSSLVGLDYLGIREKDRIVINESFFRPSEINDIYGDNSKAIKVLGWDYQMDFKEVIIEILNEYKANFYNV